MARPSYPPKFEIRPAPSVQIFPDRPPAGFADCWKCDGPSGNLVSANGTILASGGGPIRYGAMVPSWNGEDYTSARAIEFKGTGPTNEAFEASTGLYGLSQSVTWVYALRLARVPTNTRGLMGNRAGGGSGNPGYHAFLSGSMAAPAIQVCDGTSVTQANGPGLLSDLDGLANGALHLVAFSMNVTTGMMTVMALRSQGTPVPMPTGPKIGSAPWRLGGQPFLYSCECLQIPWFGVLLGSNAEQFTVDDLAALDNYCRVPAGIVGYVRNSVVAPIVGRNASGVVVQPCAGSPVTPTKTDFAHVYSPMCPAPGNVAVLSERGSSLNTTSITSTATYQRNNRLRHTDDLSDTAAWTLANITATKNHGEDPAGFMAAACLIANTPNAYVAQDFACEAGEAHTISVFADGDGFIEAARLSAFIAGVEVYGIDLLIGPTRERYIGIVPGAAIGSATTLQWRLTLRDVGASIHATFAQAEFGMWAASYQPQRSSLLYRDDIEGRPDVQVDPMGGRIEVDCVGLAENVGSTGCFVFDTGPAVGQAGRLLCTRNAVPYPHPDEFEIHDSAGAVVAQIPTLAVPNLNAHRYALTWDARYVVAVGEVDGRSYPAGLPIAPVAPWTPGTGGVDLYVATRHGGSAPVSAHLEGGWYRCAVWSRPP